jgi:predicted unusual protein kinase regulating ubiquinone biosynthesis (AarF/ABC1/UbiB family)
VTADEGPPRGRLARTARLAALPAAFAGRTAIGIGKRLGGHPAEVVAAQVQQRTAEQLFATLGQLKGGAMKVGQAMSAMEAALPEQLAGPYREALVRLQEAAPPMPTALVHQQLDRAFPDGWRQLLSDLGDRPVAAASVGQVHRATWSDGTPVAVKVQYPGAGAALLTDLGTLSGLAPVIRAAAPGLDARQLIAELRDRLAAEVDYHQEAAAQTAFADAYRGDPDLLVPDVLAVRDQVLVSRWVDGTPLSRVIAEGTADQRDRAGLLLVRLLASAPVRAGRLHGDPHPGNFRLLPDGRLVVLDFGATEALPHGWPARLGPFLAAGRDGDTAALHRLAVTARLAPQELQPGALADLLGPYFAPLRTPSFAFTRGWLREQTRRVSDPFSAAARIQRHLSVPPRHLMLQRVVAGLVGVLCSLGATVAVDAEVLRWVPGYDSELH